MKRYIIVVWDKECNDFHNYEIETSDQEMIRFNTDPCNKKEGWTLFHERILQINASLFDSRSFFTGRRQILNTFSIVNIIEICM